MCVNFFGEHFFKNAKTGGKFIKPIYANEIITTHGVIRDKVPEGNGYRFKVDMWADNEEGELKTIAWAEVYVE
jgi:hypothetical protein